MIRSLVVLCLLARVATADGDAERLFNEGQHAYEAKNYDAAIASWTQAYELSKLPALLFNLAQAQRLGGHCQKALDGYKQFVVADPAADDRPAAEQFIKELSPCPVARPIPIAGKTEDLGASKRKLGIATIAGGGAVFATGVLFGIRAASLGSDVKDACAIGCEFSEIADKDSAGRRDEKLQYVFLGVGAVAIAVGAWFYVRGRKARETPVVMVHGRGAAVGWQF